MPSTWDKALSPRSMLNNYIMGKDPMDMSPNDTKLIPTFECPGISYLTPSNCKSAEYCNSYILRSCNDLPERVKYNAYKIKNPSAYAFGWDGNQYTGHWAGRGGAEVRTAYTNAMIPGACKYGVGATLDPSVSADNNRFMLDATRGRHKFTVPAIFYDGHAVLFPARTAVMSYHFESGDPAFFYRPE
ncbi:hypothetical protein SDC9_178416 [bioreactor metagenome]|uniref:Uncharacterized protein n=1 Tax=bioreactor metagenome TaxID=1076179 RepID=A0A645GVX0_9ZZZZ